MNRSGKRWTEKEKETLLRLAKTKMAQDDIGRRLGRSLRSIYNQLAILRNGPKPRKTPQVYQRKHVPTIEDYGGTRIASMRDREQAEIEIAKIYGGRRYDGGRAG